MRGPQKLSTTPRNKALHVLRGWLYTQLGLDVINKQRQLGLDAWRNLSQANKQDEFHLQPARYRPIWLELSDAYHDEGTVHNPTGWYLEFRIVGLYDTKPLEVVGQILTRRADPTCTRYLLLIHDPVHCQEIDLIFFNENLKKAYE